MLRLILDLILVMMVDLVDIQEDGTVTVNGQTESYVQERDAGTLDIDLPCRVPTDSWFVLGDHRAVSIDSRSSAVGCLTQEQMIGRIVLRIWPPERFGLLTGDRDTREE